MLTYVVELPELQLVPTNKVKVYTVNDFFTVSLIYIFIHFFFFFYFLARLF